MRINSIQQYQYSRQVIQEKPNFRAASDITLKYVLEHHAKYLPKRVLEEIKHLDACGESHLYTLQELHAKIYKSLFEAKSLEKVKAEYEEFQDVIDVVKFSDSRSKTIKAIKAKMPLEEFTLEYLKQVYTPVSQESIIKELGLKNRSSLDYLNEQLGIKKLSSPYIALLKMSNEEQNQRIAELSRRAIYANAEAQKYRLERAAEAHRTPEYRAKKRQEMIDFYVRNPEVAERTGRISQETWDRCPEIKEALSVYTRDQSDYVKSALRKRRLGIPITEQERRTLYGYYDRFWQLHPEFPGIISRVRNQVIEDLFGNKI